MVRNTQSGVWTDSCDTTSRHLTVELDDTVGAAVLKTLLMS